MPASMIRPALLASVLLLAACQQSTPADAPAAAGPSVGERVAAAAEAVNPVTSPRDDVIAAMERMRNVRSYHGEMEIDLGAKGKQHNAVDFVAPDLFRMQMQGIGTQIIAGDTMYMEMNGERMKVPMPAGTLTQWRDPGKLDEIRETMTVEAQGSDTVAGRPARKYLVHNSLPKPTDVTMWIADGLPVRILSVAPEGSVTIDYSRFDDPQIVIDRPN